MRFLFSVFLVVFVFVFLCTSTSRAVETQVSISGKLKDDGHVIKNLALEQSRSVKEHIDRFVCRF